MKESDTKQRKPIRFLRLIKLLISVVIIWIIASTLSALTSWKAVFIDGNQVFFGKGINIPFTRYMTLKKVHYIKPDASSVGDSVSKTPEEGTSANNIIIAPLSDMVHGPEDTMKINKDKILFYEKLRNNTVLVNGLSKSE